ncbi:MAG: O-antigen ligase family protein [Candidatus Omnitrophica bacterium]|nr:O-antigen ligase family protein [Candidatus Omnitrophota bacterium]
MTTAQGTPHNSFVITVLFIWISFLAPLLVRGGRFIFLPVGAMVMWNLMRGKEKTFWAQIKEDKVFWLFWASILLGVGFAEQRLLALKYFAYFFLPAPLIYFLAKCSFDKGRVILLLRISCAIASVVALIGLVEFIARRNILYESFFPNLYYTLFRGRRIFSTQSHPAALGTYLAVMIPLAVLWFRKEIVRSYKRCAFVAIVFMGMVVILTFSRGALVSLVVACALMILLSSGKRKGVLFLLLFFAVIIVIVGSSFLYEQGFIPAYPFSIHGLYARGVSQTIYGFDRFLAAVNMFRSHSIFGAGLGHFRDLFDVSRPHTFAQYAVADKVADSMFLTFLAETGVVGFVAFVGFVVALLIKAYKKIVSGQGKEYVRLFFFAGFCGFLCNFLTYDTLYWMGPNYLFWWYTGILSAIAGEA